MTTDTKVMQFYINKLEADSAILKLLKEIETTTHFPLDHLSSGMVIQYLKDLRSRRPITKDSIDAIFNSSKFLLKQKINKIEDPQLIKLCQEIANNKGSRLEEVMRMTLYVFLDKYLNDKFKPNSRKSALLPGNLYP